MVVGFCASTSLCFRGAFRATSSAFDSDVRGSRRYRAFASGLRVPPHQVVCSSEKSVPSKPVESSSEAVAGSSTADSTRPRTVLVDELIDLIQDEDGGPSTPLETRLRANDIIRELSDSDPTAKYLSSPSIFDNYSVAYTSPPTNRMWKENPPAGGQFRGRLGRLLLPTRGVFQHVLSPDIVVNLVAFRLFGALSGAVSLRGRLRPLPDTEIGLNGIAVNFQPPRIMLGGTVFEFGSDNSVRIRVSYMDERVRIGIGGRGSFFVFTRGGSAQAAVAEEWRQIYPEDGSKPLPIWILLSVVLGFLGAAIKLAFF